MNKQFNQSLPRWALSCTRGSVPWPTTLYLSTLRGTADLVPRANCPPRVPHQPRAPHPLRKEVASIHLCFVRAGVARTYLLLYTYVDRAELSGQREMRGRHGGVPDGCPPRAPYPRPRSVGSNQLVVSHLTCQTPPVVAAMYPRQRNPPCS